MSSHVQDKSPSVTSGMLLAGKYRIERLLGEGGMGVVLAATNEALRQRVAIKLLRSSALANSKALRRFEREAHAAASLRSEHVARVLDVGELTDGRPFMVMEYLEGRDLGDVIDEGPYLPVGELVDYVLQACEAIAEAHAAGIIHRDLKPRNLFLTTTVDGRPLIKVLDFGISKIQDAAEDMSLTRTTEIIGSPSYMSPEQLRASKEVDVRTDIWALGVILYELLSKKVPFQAVTVTELVAVVLMEPTPDIRRERSDVPEGLAYAINRCLAKRREDRFSSVSELVGAIAPFGSGANATMAERISRVAQGSARQLPPSDTGSGPYAQLSASGPRPALPRAMAVLAGSASGSGSQPGASSGSNRGSNPSDPNGFLAEAPRGMPVARGDTPPPASSARLNIHGGTSVAWGETQVDSPNGSRRSRWPLIAVAAGLFVVLTGAGTGTLFYMKRATATPTAPVVTPPADSIALPSPLPMGRKDLAPIPTVVVPRTGLEPTTSVVAEAPSTMPSSRIPRNPTTAAAKPPKPPAQPVAPPPTSGKPPDDLTNIGRR